MNECLLQKNQKSPKQGDFRLSVSFLLALLSFALWARKSEEVYDICTLIDDTPSSGVLLFAIIVTCKISFLIENMYIQANDRLVDSY